MNKFFIFLILFCFNACSFTKENLNIKEESYNQTIFVENRIKSLTLDQKLLSEKIQNQKQIFQNLQNKDEKEITLLLIKLNYNLNEDKSIANYILDSVNTTYKFPKINTEDYRKLKIIEAELETNKKEIEDLVTKINLKKDSNKTINTTNNIQLEKISTDKDSKDFNNFQTKKIINLQNKRPLITIKFNKENINYEEPLYKTLTEILEKNNFAMFQIEGITKQNTNNISITNRINQILKSLKNMGVPTSRISVIMKSDNTNTDEIKIYTK